MFDHPHETAALRDLPLERLEAEITQQAAHLAAGMCRFLLLVAEFDRREGWAAWGCRSCAHWLSWHCGISLGPARQQVRVARALEDLPMVRAAFGRGELSFSKVRALIRIATPELEADLVEMARAATAAQIERVASGYRGTMMDPEDAMLRHEARYLRSYVDDDGSLVIRVRLDPEDGEMVMKAIETAVEAARRERCSQRADESPGGVSAETHEVGSPRDVSAETHDEHLDVVPGSPMDPAGRIPGDPEDPWGAERADALVALSETFLATGPRALPGGERHCLILNVDAAALAGESAVPIALDSGGGIPAETARRLGCDASVVPVVTGANGEVLSVGRRRRTIPPAIRRALRVRDQRCRFPGCPNHRRLVGHHVHHWAHGGPTDLGNLVHLCSFHHRLVHEGGFRAVATGAGAILFLRPDGRVLHERWATQPRSDFDAIREQHRELGIEINAETPVAGWDGKRPDYGFIVSALATRAESLVGSTQP